MKVAERLARLSPAHQRLWQLWAEKGSSDREQLVAFVVPRPEATVEAEDLRLFASYHLPSHMVPTQIAIVPELPRSASGKLDRSRFMLKDANPAPPREPVAPRDEVERRLVALFEHVLQYQPVGIFDDFFADLGGHSLLATQLISAVRREWNCDVPLRLLFEHPNVAGLAKALPV